MRGAGDGQKLGEPLDDGEQYHLKKRHAEILSVLHGIFVI
jgi:hypothetical protein